MSSWQQFKVADKLIELITAGKVGIKTYFLFFCHELLIFTNRFILIFNIGVCPFVELWFSPKVYPRERVEHEK